MMSPQVLLDCKEVVKANKRTGVSEVGGGGKMKRLNAGSGLVCEGHEGILCALMGFSCQ